MWLIPSPQFDGASYVAISFGWYRVLLAFVVATPIFAEDFVYEINEAVWYVNSAQTNIFNPGDTLTGTSRATVHAADSSITTYYYYVRARMLAFTQSTPVTDWVEYGEWIAHGVERQLVPPVSQYTIPIPNFSSDFTYEVQLRCIPNEQGGPPEPHITLASQTFGFTY